MTIRSKTARCVLSPSTAVGVVTRPIPWSPFVASAIITPPDVSSQLMMAVPMIILYIVSIGLAALFGNKPSEAQREAFQKSKAKS